MKVIHVNEANPYSPPLHHGMVALKLSDKTVTGAKKFWCGLSHFLPGGGADWAYEDSSTEKIYIVLEGEITIKTKDDNQTLSKGDLVYLAPFEGRSVINSSRYPASMLVISNND